MLRYIIKRIIWVIPTLIGVLVLLFSLISLLPGNAASVMLGPRATPQLIAALNHRLHLDKPFLSRLGYYLYDVGKGDLGTSVWSGRSVSSLIAEALPYTVELAISSLFIASIVGILMGAFAALRRGSPMGGAVTLFSLLCVALPDFVAALLLMLLFCVKFPIFPALGAGENGNLIDIGVHLILPATALAIGWVGYLSRLTQESMLQVLDADYIRTARAFAIDRRIITYQYTLKNAVIPTITVIGLGVGKLLAGAIFVEIIFNRPGLGTLIVDAVYARDFPVVQGGIIVATVLFVFANLVADISYAFIDPRIKYK